MAFERDLWLEAFSQDDVPPFVCPMCKKGRLVADEGSLVREEPAYSKHQHKHEAWDPDWIVERFVLLLRCKVKKCGEVVAVSGDVTFEEVAEDDYRWSLESMLRPRSMFPASPVIAIPEETPRKVRTEIELSFRMVWCDAAAAANRLRTSVEFLLDDFKMPREAKSKKNKTRRLSLQERINLFNAVDPDYATTLDALRIVGNLGTHESTIQREVLLDAFAIYEDALSELFGKHKKKIEALRKKIVARRGKY